MHHSHGQSRPRHVSAQGREKLEDGTYNNKVEEVPNSERILANTTGAVNGEIVGMVTGTVLEPLGFGGTDEGSPKTGKGER
ncbi:hypothetical protein YTPLAS18_05790 [Nitrospira sp.]|nr:hypothetical protein YTPLAS18_05790 [Nitrospira sp.]